ncbi:MAG: beta-ketoacyl-[acyl-carrier-protein] synthase family protein [Caulobacteraceae bacterium]
MTHRVAVTGLGAVSALGQGMAVNWSGVAEGRSGIRLLDRPLDDEPAWRMAGPAGFIDTLDLTQLEARFGARALAQLDPVAAYSVLASFEALADADLLDDPVLDTRTAVLYGCGSGGNASNEVGYHRIYAKHTGSVHPLTIPKGMISAPASHISMVFGIHGPSFVLSSACTSSAHALGEAMHMIRSGRVDVAVAGGAEAGLTLGNWAGWVALRAMATDTCRPFSSGRQGLILGEGACTLVLERWDRAEARGARIYGELIGYGASSDAKHLTAPDADGMRAAIANAHEDAEVSADTPVLVSSHGTGTALNDKTETEALQRFYDGALQDNLVIATKSAHAHLIGGSGALEFAISLLALQKGLAPPILNWSGRDPECDLPLALTATPIDYEFVVSNSFAFGGLNGVLIGRRV